MLRTLSLPAVLLAGLSCLAGGSAAEIRWGANGHPFEAYRNIDLGYEGQLDLLADLGMRSYRVDVNRLDHADALERLVREGKKRGIDILPVLIPPADLVKWEPERLYKTAFEFARTFVARFKDDVPVFELGNELEIHAILKPCEMQDDGKQYNCAWGPASGVTKLEYHGGRWRKVSAVLKGLSEGARAAHPGVRRAMGTAGWGHTGAFDRMQDDGIEWEISVWHLYEDTLEKPDWRQAIDKVKWGIERVARHGKPIWITEFNASRGSEKGDRRQAAGLLRTMLVLGELDQRYRIEAAHVYELLDEPYWKPSFEAYMGLVDVVPAGERGQMPMLSTAPRRDGPATQKDGAARANPGGWAAGVPKPAYCVARSLIRGGWRLGHPHPLALARANASALPDTAPPADHARACNLCLHETRSTSLSAAVSYAYCLALGRNPDGGGLQSWIRDLERGSTDMPRMLLTMVRTRLDEIETRAGRLSDDAYVRLLWRELLDREPGGDAREELTALENGQTDRDAVVRRVIASPEFARLHPLLLAKVATRVQPGN